MLPFFGGAASAFLRLKQEMDEEVTISESYETDTTLPLDAALAVEFRNVSFEYAARPDQPVLRSIDLKFPAGKTTAIVGVSGSGKSTIASLITRLYDPTDGIICFDGQDVRSLDVKSLRSHIGLIQQEPILLDCSILENIALGLISSPKPFHQALKPFILNSQLASAVVRRRDDPNWDLRHEPVIQQILDLVREAAVLADAANFIEQMEHNYFTLAGSSGNQLSGGQKQRIALARAIIRQPKILILDEATSSLDSASEQRIQSAVNRFAADKTVISIAHRFSTIRDADNIIVMRAGEVVETGTYAELMERDATFASMAKLQRVELEDEGNAASKSITSDDSTDPKVVLSTTLNAHKTKLAIEGSTAKEEVTAPSQDDLDSNKSFFAIMKGLSWLMRPTLVWLLVALFGGIIVGGTFSASGLIFGHTVSALNPCNTTPNKILQMGKFFGGFMFMLAAVELLANFVCWSSFGVFAEKLLYKIRVLTFRSLLEQDLEWHQSGDRKPTDLLSVITKDTTLVGGFSGSIMGTMFSIFVNVLAAVILSHIIAWKIAIICLAAVPILLIAGVVQMRALGSFAREYSQAYANAITIAVEAVNSIKTIAAFSLEEETMGRYCRALTAPTRSIFMGNIFANLCLSISTTVGLFIYSLVYWWGSHLIIKGEYTQTQFFIILVAMVISAQLWGQTFALAPEVSRAQTSASRIQSLIQIGSTTQVSATLLVDQDTCHSPSEDLEALSSENPLTRSRARGLQIEFREVSFSYPKRPLTPALQDLTFQVQRGQFVGLVGQSGAGKSTIFNLVQRIYKAASGTIWVDGVDIALRDPGEYRAEVAIVPQGNTLFSGSVKFNVALGAHVERDATDLEIEEACRTANIHDTIMAMPEGYDTECGPNGSRLSGGQRQRLAIARALVRKPRLLLLDESTSALDSESERALQEGLENVVRSNGTTVIAISHRLHTLQRADIIFVVEGGRITDAGRHGDLLSRNATYKANAQQQILQ
jgi:ATP-binding cassette subfamily B (MDR/TAP) protein 1